MAFLLEHIKANGPMRSLLFDTDQGIFYSCVIAEIKVSVTPSAFLTDEV
jgi:hypothetical protein